MERPLQLVSNFRELYYGEPFSMEELEKIPHLHLLAKGIRDALQYANKYVRDIELQNKHDYEQFVALLHHDLIFHLKITQNY